MIDSYFRSPYQRYCIEPLLRSQALCKLPPTLITCAAGACGLAVLPLLAFHCPFFALLFLGLSGFLDTLDGSLARHLNKISIKGAVSDILSDRMVESAVIIGLFLIDPAIRALPCLCMSCSILLCVTSFLVVGIFTQNTSQKSFHYSPGWIERGEAFLFFAAMIALPSLFGLLAYAFSALVLATALMRYKEFCASLSK